jgi:hypothetical protein
MTPKELEYREGPVARERFERGMIALFKVSKAAIGKVVVVQFPEEQLRCLPLSIPPSHLPSCHPEDRAFCGPKDLCNLPALRRCRQIA